MSQHSHPDEKTAVQFYEDRYEQGYMEEWPEEKKERIIELLRGLTLPPTGDVLDFGCGNGVLTDMLRRALPAGWNVFGSEISSIAIENARSRFANCRFFRADDPEFAGRKFDLIFTHHVLEHVIDLPSTVGIMDGLLKDRCAMFHILPCGNPGSFEHKLATMRRGGIDPAVGNRFFFEDEGHVRRLTTQQLADELKAYDFHLTGEYYSHQHHGGVEWITRYGDDVVLNIADPEQAIDPRAADELRELRRELLSIQRMRERARQYRERLSKPEKSWKNYAYLVLKYPGFIRADIVERSSMRKAREEWASHKLERNGSEMYLFFQRERRPGRAGAGTAS